jgi:hypothetical protein
MAFLFGSLQSECSLVVPLSLGHHNLLLSLHNLCHGNQDAIDNRLQVLLSCFTGVPGISNFLSKQ